MEGTHPRKSVQFGDDIKFSLDTGNRPGTPNRSPSEHTNPIASIIISTDRGSTNPSPVHNQSQSQSQSQIHNQSQGSQSQLIRPHVSAAPPPPLHVPLSSSSGQMSGLSPSHSNAQLPNSLSNHALPLLSVSSPQGMSLNSPGELAGLMSPNVPHAPSPSLIERSTRHVRSVHGFKHEKEIVGRLLKELARPRGIEEDSDTAKCSAIILDGPIGCGKSVLQSDLAKLAKTLLLTSATANGHKSARCLPLRPFHDMLVELLKLRPSKDPNFKEKNCTYVMSSSVSRRKSLWQNTDVEITEKDKLPVQIRVAATSHGTSTFLQKLLPGWADFEAAPIPSFENAGINSDEIYNMMTRRELIQILTALLKSASRRSPLVVFCNDIQYFDSESLELCLNLAREIKHAILIFTMDSTFQENPTTWKFQQESPFLDTFGVEGFRRLKEWKRQLNEICKVHEIGLPPLSSYEIKRIADERVTPLTNIRDSLLSRICEKASGNPLLLKNDDIISDIPSDIPGAADMLIRQLSQIDHVVLAIGAMLGAEFTKDGIEEVLKELQKENLFSLAGANTEEITLKSVHNLCMKMGLFKIVHMTDISPIEKDKHRHSFVINNRSYPTTSTAMLGSLKRRMSTMNPTVASRNPGNSVNSLGPSPRRTSHLSASNLGNESIGHQPPMSPRSRNSLDPNMAHSMGQEAPSKPKHHCIYGVANEVFRDRAVACLSQADLKKISEAVLEYFSTYHSGRRSCWYLHAQDCLSCTIHSQNHVYGRKVLVQASDFLGTATVRGMREYGWWLGQIFRMDPDVDDDLINHAQYGRWVAEVMGEVGFGQIVDAKSGIDRGLMLIQSKLPPKSKYALYGQLPYLITKHLKNWIGGGKDLLELPSAYTFPPDMRFPLPLTGMELPDEEHMKNYETLLILDRYAEYLQMKTYYDEVEPFHNALTMVNIAEKLGNCTAILSRSYARLAADYHRRGFHWIARRYFRLATSISKRSGDSPATLFVFCYVGTAAIEIASWSAVQESLEIAMTLYGKRSSAASGVHFISPLQERYARLAIAVAAEYRGKFDEAGQYYQELAEMASQRKWSLAEGDSFMDDANEDLPTERAWCRIWGCSGRAAVLLIQGQVSEPLRLLSIAFEQAKKHKDELPHEMLHVCPLYAAAMCRAEKSEEEIREILDMSGVSKNPPVLTATFGFALLQSYSFAVDVYLELWRSSNEKQIYGANAWKALKLLKKFSNVYAVGIPRYKYWMAKYNFLSHRRPAALIEWRECIEEARRLATPFEEGLASLELALHFKHSELRRNINQESDLKHGVSPSIHFLQTAQRIFRQTNVPQLERISQQALSKEYELALQGPTNWTKPMKQQPETIAAHNYTSYENIGRDKEVTAIKISLQKIVSNPTKPTVVIIEGDQGMGKSHIISELRVAADILNVTTIFSQADFRDHRSPFFSWRSILTFTFGLDNDISKRDEMRSNQQILDLLSTLQIPLLYACLFNSLLSVSVEDNDDILQLPKARRTDILFEMIFRVIVGRFSQEGKETPTPHIIIIEDVHSMDEPSWGLLMRLIGMPLTSIIESSVFEEALVPNLDYLPILFVLTARRVGDPPAGYRMLEELVIQEPTTSNYLVTFIRLSSIQRSQTKQILGIMLGDISEEVVNYVHEMSSGNPMFVREIVNFLTATKSIHQFPSGQWHLIQQLTTLPDSLKSALSERMDSLSTVQRDLLGFCAVFHKAGDSTDQVSKITLASTNFAAPLRFLVKAYQNDDAYEDVGYVPSEEDEEMMLNIIKPDLEKLNYLGLLKPNVSLMFSGNTDGDIMEEPGYMINHAMLRDWCYRLLNSQERKRLHHLAARWIEKTAGSNVTVVHPSFLAFHFGKAGESARAMFYLELASYRYRKKGMFLQMASVMAEALSIGDKQDEPDLFRRAVWEVAYAEANLGLGRLGRCARHINSALSLFGVNIISSSKFTVKFSNWKLRSKFQNSSILRLPVTMTVSENELWYNNQQSIDAINPEFMRDLFGEAGLKPSSIILRGLVIMAQARRYRIHHAEYLTTCFALMNIMQQTVQFPPEEQTSFALSASMKSEILSHYTVASFAHKSILPIQISTVDLNGPAEVVLMITHSEYLISQTRFEECLELLKNILKVCEKFNLDHEWDRCMSLLALVHRFIGHLSICTQVYDDLCQKIRHVGYHHSEASAVWGQIEALVWSGGIGSATNQLALVEEDVETDDIHVSIFQAAISAMIAMRLDDHATCFQKLITASEVIEQYRSKSWYGTLPVLALSTLCDMASSLLEMESMAHRMRPGALDNTRQRVLQHMIQEFVGRLDDLSGIYPCAKSAYLLWYGVMKWTKGNEERAISYWEDCIEEASKTKMLPDMARAHFEIGRHAPSGSESRTENLSKSVRLFADMRAGYWATRAQQELTAVPIAPM